MSNNQFEFMVLSGAVEVRNNIDASVVASQFDPDRHHVPIWSVANTINAPMKN
jgi:hypothetical protein